METLQGYIRGIIYHNHNNNYYVSLVRLDQKKRESIIIVGYFDELKKDELYRFNGEFKTHPKYGSQFVVESYEKVLPNDKEAIIRFLSSSLFPRIGRKTAEKVYDLLGDKCLEIIKDNPSKLDPLEFKKEQVDSLIKGLNSQSRLEEAMKLFVGHGLTMKTLLKLDALYKEDMTHVILNNPYRMIKDIDGINFKYADKIALSLGIDKKDERRIKAAIVYCLNRLCFRYQSTYISYVLIKKETTKLIDELTDEEFNKSYDGLVKDEEIIVEEDRVYPYSLFEAEVGIANYLYPYFNKKISYIEDEDINKAINEVEDESKIEYSDEQKAAIKMAVSSGISIISGGPGTGKTTVVNALIRVYEKLFGEGGITLCAPTGRAAKRLSELTNKEATTIHRLLGWNMESNVFIHDENDPLIGDLLIVDEFSMVDAVLFYQLLKGTHPYQQIVLIGDDEQLPPVNAGDVLHELLSLDKIKHTSLQKIHRQKETSGIIPLAYDVRHGIFNEENLQKDDVIFVNCSSYEVKDLVIYFASKALERGYTSEDIQVLAPMYDGVAGIDALNVALQDLFNPKSLTKKEYQIGKTIYREKDKILQLKNQVDDDVYNGDIGILDEIILDSDEVKFIVNFDGNYITYNKDNFINITHAYCISVHKSQGSEYPIVIFPILYDYRIMLRKKLVYTGITRTRKSLILLGNIDAFKYSLTNDQKIESRSTIKKRIKEKLGW
ncbi:TPA: ATP-dependent RecD-like DNA helicase [bacterium]|nr:ATP-dependent RecD-like DNA helicase [bacterium]